MVVEISTFRRRAKGAISNLFREVLTILIICHTKVTKAYLMKIKLYTDLLYCASKDSNSKFLNPIIWAQQDNGTPDDKKKKHHARFTHFELVSNIEEADWCALPDVWSEYVKRGAVQKALAFSEIADKAGKLVLIWAGGDPEWIIPIKNGIQVQEGLHQSIKRKTAFAFERPGFVEDYIETYYEGRWSPSPLENMPTIGFCGMAKSRIMTRIHFYLQNWLANIKYHAGISAVVPILHGFPVDLRAKTLNLLNQSGNTKCNFIIRDLYRGGVSKKIPNLNSHTVRAEFVNNIFDNAYNVCVRGGGNFSKRFYETLACGRIPILVNTDVMLPYQEFIEWKKRVVWVELSEIGKIAEKVMEFHSQFSPSEFADLQMENRNLWKTMLFVRGYYENFHKYLSVTKSS